MGNPPPRHGGMTAIQRYHKQQKGRRQKKSGQATEERWGTIYRCRRRNLGRRQKKGGAPSTGAAEEIWADDRRKVGHHLQVPVRGGGRYFTWPVIKCTPAGGDVKQLAGHLHVPRSIERILHTPMCDNRYGGPQSHRAGRHRGAGRWRRGTRDPTWQPFINMEDVNITINPSCSVYSCDLQLSR